MNPNRLLLGLLLAGIAACGTQDGSETSSAAVPTPREVRFTANDFTFQGPASIEAGLVTFVLTNDGPNWHHLQLIRLPDGMTLEAFQEALGQMQPGSPPPPWLVEAGGVNPPATGGSAEVTMTIEPGEYAVVCLVDTPDFVPHAFKGMITGLTVTPARTPAAALPPAHVTLTLVDYAFSFATPPTAGSHVIRVVNDGPQAHEVAFFKLLPGKTMDDVMAYAQTYQGEPPMTPAGGVPGIRPGQAVDVSVDFTPGDWVALCFLPDATDGQLHVVHGMMLPFRIS